MNGSPDPDRFGVLVADDHLLFRDGLRSLVLAMSEAQLVGEAADGREAVALAATCRPDVIVMDLRMPLLDGVEATRRILADNPEVRILVVSMLDDDASVFAAMRAGARGYILKGAGHTEVTAAIRSVHRGEAIFGADIAVRMASYFARLTPSVDEVLCLQPWGIPLDHLDCDISIWHGAQDGVVPVSDAHTLAGLLNTNRLHIDPDQGHGLILARWAEIAAGLVA